MRLFLWEYMINWKIDHIISRPTIMFLLFRDFFMVEQIFLSPQLKRNVIITNKLVIQNNLRVVPLFICYKTKLKKSLFWKNICVFYNIYIICRKKFFYIFCSQSVVFLKLALPKNINKLFEKNLWRYLFLVTLRAEDLEHN